MSIDPVGLEPPAEAAPVTSAPGTAAGRAPGVDGVWAPERRRLTLGLVLTITLVAFESLAISTVMPVVSDDLGGLSLYGWVFSGFFLGNLLGIVTAGQAADTRGTAYPFAVGLALFSAGLLVGGLAPSMGVLVAARVAQGIGAGAIPAIAYATVGRRYPASLRPRVFAVFSSAWVIPGLIGPAAAGAIEHALSWHYVFLALLPFVVLAGAITIPVLSRDAPVGAPPPDLSRRRRALVLVGGVGAVLVAISGAPAALAAALLGAGLPLAGWAFLRLVPAGTARLLPGMPAAIMLRGILTFAFFGGDAYVSLTLQDVRGQSTFLTGVSLTATTVLWTAGAWIQERWVARVGPRRLLVLGLALVGVGTLGLLGALGPLPLWAAIPIIATAGLGIGLAYAPISVTVLGLAAAGREGQASASLQLTDVLGVSLGTGLGGAFVALGESRGWPTRSALELTFAATLAVSLLGILASRRMPATLPD